MSGKYHIPTQAAAPRFPPVGPLCTIEADGCLGCLDCVKRHACVYDVYRKRVFHPESVVDTADILCMRCMRCVQACRKNILSRVRNPRYDLIGNTYWTPDMLSKIWKQAETGRIPVSGTGYGGPFAGPGFDQIWTDMSEIVRPTRDGIHGREYISTVVELGRRPGHLQFDEEGALAVPLPAFIELPIPLLFSLPACRFAGATMHEAVYRAAARLGTQVLATPDEAPAPSRMLELPDHAHVLQQAGQLQAERNLAAVSIRLPLHEGATQRAIALASSGAGVLHLAADEAGQGGPDNAEFATTLVRAIHEFLLNASLREQVTLLYSGGIALPEHVAKIIACGADAVVVDRALAVALECRLCTDCEQRGCCPVSLDELPVGWAAQRIVNLTASWHAQLIEILGAMGLREIRRLRGELGRVMFFEDLERENFAPLFGTRRPARSSRSPAPDHNGTTLLRAQPAAYTALPRETIRACPSRFRNRLVKYRVVRTSACQACGACAEICRFGVHARSGRTMARPKAWLCRGENTCREPGAAYCAAACPANALRTGKDPSWDAFGDARWTADLLAATWVQAETGLPPPPHLECRTGLSGGGFDRIDIVTPREPAPPRHAETISLSVALNRRDTARPGVEIDIPFYGGGMSYGSISLTTMLARARAYEHFNSLMCTGEGGYPEELIPHQRHVITQIATGLFGVSEETIQRTRLVEFKYAQGAKPGLGGHLLGDKVTPAVARLREAVPGSALFSPFPFHSVYSIEDHKKHVDWIKAINPEALISVKVSSASDVDMVAYGSYCAGAHIVHVDGSYGGTGAAPDIAKKNIAMPLEYAIPRVHRFLCEEGVREDITLVASGGLRSAWDIIKVIALGADAVVIGTAEMVALECIRCGACESGRGCPRGIATTDPELDVLYDVDWATRRLINLFHAWSLQLRGILAALGLSGIRELVGRTDVLRHADYEPTESIS